MKTVLITGGTGSFGTAFCRDLLENDADVHVRALARDEYKMHVLQTELSKYEDRLSCLIGDVRDLNRMQMACRGVDTVIHAAALKRIDMMEYNPIELVRTNVYGTENVARACIDQCVSRAVLLSTDKAVAPVNAYGMSKALAERLWVQSNSYSPHQYGTSFNVARYGNVMGSRGSVLELYRQLAQEGKGLPLTHPDMTRFWMDMPDAVALVRFILSLSLKGVTVVPILPAFRISHLCLAFGCGNYQVGIRPGEKLHEQLLAEHEQARAMLAQDKYLAFAPETHDWAKTLSFSPDWIPYAGFIYRSDVWDRRLNVSAIKERIYGTQA